MAHRSILRERWVDVVVRGPGEAAAVALADVAEKEGRLANTQLLAQIPNLAYLDGRREISLGGAVTDRVLETNYGSLVTFLGQPPVDYTLLPVEAYFTGEVRDISYLSSTGCPTPAASAASPRRACDGGRACRLDGSSTRWRTCGPPTDPIRSDQIRSA
ncbi:hypothetical protein ABZT48_42425 [Streptomyces avermitilis]|uniref:hypothetical protein n=1 Tax=Streptomyces avermitilis TaxID=33903 RepID=UPI0033BB3774